jgi:hypothetical protein
VVTTTIVSAILFGVLVVAATVASFSFFDVLFCAQAVIETDIVNINKYRIFFVMIEKCLNSDY